MCTYVPNFKFLAQFHSPSPTSKRTPKNPPRLGLKELRNWIPRIIRVWSLFCSILFYKVSTFHRFIWKLVLVVLRFLCFLSLLCWIRCNLHELYNICIIIVYMQVSCNLFFFFDLWWKTVSSRHKNLSTTINRKNMSVASFWVLKI